MGSNGGSNRLCVAASCMASRDHTGAAETGCTHHEARGDRLPTMQDSMHAAQSSSFFGCRTVTGGALTVQGLCCCWRPQQQQKAGSSCSCCCGRQVPQASHGFLHKSERPTSPPMSSLSWFPRCSKGQQSTGADAAFCGSSHKASKDEPSRSEQLSGVADRKSLESNTGSNKAYQSSDQS